MLKLNKYAGLIYMPVLLALAYSLVGIMLFRRTSAGADAYMRRENVAQLQYFKSFFDYATNPQNRECGQAFYFTTRALSTEEQRHIKTSMLAKIERCSTPDIDSVFGSGTLSPANDSAADPLPR